MHTVVEAFDVHANDAVEVVFGRALNRSDVRDAGVVDKDVSAAAAKQFGKGGLYFRLVDYITKVRAGRAAGGGDSLAGRGCRGFV